MRRPVPALAITFLAATLSAAIAQGTKHATVPGGGTTNAAPKQLSFSLDQVTRGRTAYLANCAYCHGTDLGGLNGPALAGPNTNVSWQTGSAVWGYTTEQMPVGNAGGLPTNDYLDIVAYIFSRNGQHPGKRAMTVSLVANDNNRVGGAAR